MSRLRGTPPAVRTLAAAATGLVLLSTTGSVSALADDAITPAGSSLVLSGAGWGHGHGMSQYGAYGAAKQGLSYDQILAFYYPGTTLTTQASSTIRVWITADNDGTLDINPASGLRIDDTSGHKLKLPTSAKYTRWRIALTDGVRTLSYRKTNGKYATYTKKLSRTASNWYVKNTKTGRVGLRMPDGSTRTYNGSFALNGAATGPVTVNYLALDYYVRGVVPSEMSAGWGTSKNGGMAALQAQAVAARTYAAYDRARKQAAGYVYDTCDTSSCQVYKDVSIRNATSDAAVTATANRVLLYQGAPAFTQFSSSNGGWTSANPGYPYLIGQADPYDGLVKSQAWTVTLTAAQLQAAYPAIGTFTSIQVTGRETPGPYNGQGRAAAIVVTGTAGAVTVSGDAFKKTFALRERLFAISATQTATPATTRKSR